MSFMSSPASMPSQKPWSPSASSSSRRLRLIRRITSKVRSLRNRFSRRTVEPEPVSIHSLLSAITSLTFFASSLSLPQPIEIECEFVCLSTVLPSPPLSLQTTRSSLGSLGSLLEQQLERREGRQVGIPGPLTLAWREELWMARREEGS